MPKNGGKNALQPDEKNTKLLRVYQDLHYTINFRFYKILCNSIVKFNIQYFWCGKYKNLFLLFYCISEF